MVAPNDVLAWVLLAGVGVAVGWAIHRNTRQLADVEVASVDRGDGVLRARVALTNRADVALALETCEITKVRDGPDVERWVVDVDDDVRIPVQPDERLEGWVEFRTVGGVEVPPDAKLRVLFVFRSPGGPEMAEAWVG